MILLLILILICNVSAKTFKGNVLLSQKEHIEESVCFTTECIQSASRIRTWMNETVDPCEDFYGFVCGNYANIYDTDITITPLTTINQQIFRQISKILSESAKDDELEVFKISKNFYNKCINAQTQSKDQIHQDTLIKSSINLISSIENWPLLNGSVWDKESWSWLNAVQQLRRNGLPYDLLFDMAFVRDERNTSKIIIKFDRPRYCENNLNLDQIQFIREILCSYGFEEQLVDSTIKDYIFFEATLSKKNSTQKITPTSLLYSIKKLNLKFNYMKWNKLIEIILDNGIVIKHDTEIYMNHIPYFLELRKILKRTPNRVIANYFFVKTFLFITRHNRHLAKKNTIDFQKCALLTKKLLPVSVNAMYVRKYFSELPKDAIRISINMKRQLKRMIKRSDWLDSDTKINALEKLEYMTIQLGYPDMYLNDTKIENYYKNLQPITNRSLIEDEMAFNLFKTNRKFRQYGKSTKNTLMYSDISKANGLYDINRNAVSIPVGLFQGDIFGIKRPNFLNYATFGSIVAYAISSAFSLVTHLRDKHGNSVAWWDNETHENYINKTRCIEMQYKNYYNVSDTGGKVLNSLIADILSKKAAYLAYKDWSKRHSDELELPFIKFTPAQLFWISIGQNLCSSNEATTYFQNKVSPQYRVNDVVRHIIEFSEDFQCSSTSYMNIKDRCEIF